MATIKRVAQAFLAGEATTDGFGYLLHGHRIALRLADGISFDWCGWYTPTTANHINHILDAMGAGLRVSYAEARDGKAPSGFYVPHRRS